MKNNLIINNEVRVPSRGIFFCNYKFIDKQISVCVCATNHYIIKYLMLVICDDDNEKNHSHSIYSREFFVLFFRWKKQQQHIFPHHDDGSKIDSLKRKMNIFCQLFSTKLMKIIVKNWFFLLLLVSIKKKMITIEWKENNSRYTAIQG